MTRKEAKAQNLRVYAGGRACSIHGVVERYTSCGQCIPCSKIHKIKSKLTVDVEHRRALEKKRYERNKTLDKWFAHVVRQIRKRALRDNIPFNISREYIASIWTGVCPALGYDLVFMTQGMPDNLATLDRLVPARGYVEGNVTFISSLANRIKTNATPDQISAVLGWYRDQFI